MRMNKNLEKWLDCGAIFSIGNGRILIGWGEKKRGKQSFAGQTPSFYFPDYFLTDLTPWFQHECYQEMSVESLISELAHFSDLAAPQVIWKPFRKVAFDEIFDELQREMKSGQLAKAVPFIAETTAASMQRGQLVRSLSKALLYAASHSVYLYGFWDDTEGMLGLSPEILFDYDEPRHLKTMACAGTCPVEEEDSHFLADNKERYEHELVVQGIVSSLSPYGAISVGKMQLLKLSKLMHLVTPIEAKLHRPAQFEEMVEALHPTPAVGAFPKEQGRIWLEKYQQKIHRGRFGAPAGYCTAERKRAHCCVAIRNVQWDRQQMKVTAGCGIVAESKCNREWDEIQLKLKMIKEMLAL